MSNDLTPSADKLLRPGDRLGRWEIREKIGQGGMGTVFRARDTMPALAGREVAIKVLISGLFDSESLQRFFDEATALSRFEHPNIVRIIDCVVHEDQPFIVMEYLKGEDLNKLLRREPVDVDRAVDIVLSICAAIVACHRRGIIHRDLKPENVMLHRPEPDIEVVKLLDFSVSKSAVRPDLTNNGILPGTPRYMSPEQAAGAVADARSDQYAIALLLHVLLVRKKPFDEYDKPPLTVIARGMPNKAKSMRPEIPDELDSVLARGLQVDPSQRFASAHELGSKLLPFGSDKARLHWTKLFTNTPPTEIPPVLLSGPNPLAPPADNSTTADERNISTARATGITSALRKHASLAPTKSFAQAWYEQEASAPGDSDPGASDLPTPSAPPVTRETSSSPIPRRRRAIWFITGALITAAAATGFLHFFNSASTRPTALGPSRRDSQHPGAVPLASPAPPSTAPPPTRPSPPESTRGSLPGADATSANKVSASATPPEPTERLTPRALRRKPPRPASKRPAPSNHQSGAEFTEDGSPIIP